MTRIDTWEAAAAALRDAIAKQPRPLIGALVTTAEWGLPNGSFAVTVRLLDEPAQPRETLSYPALRLTEEYVASPYVVDAVLMLVRSKGEEFRSAHWERSIDEHGPNGPRWELRLALSTRGRDRPSNGSVIAFGHPPWTDGQLAITDWLGDDGWTGGDCRIQMIDRRARLRSVTFANSGAVLVGVDYSLPPEEVELQVAYRTGTRRRLPHTSVRAPGSSVTVSAPEEAESLSVYLVHRTLGLLDQKYARRKAREPPQVEEVEIVEQCKRDLAAGEDVHVEYKTWIVPYDEKQTEIAKTIVAFANTAGGRLYIGVEDDGTPSGRRQLHKTFKRQRREDPEPEEQVRSWIRKLIQEKVSPRPPLEIHLLEVYSAPVLCVSVHIGPDRPYAVSDTNEIFIRKAATSKAPDPHTELPQLMNGRNDVAFHGGDWPII